MSQAEEAAQEPRTRKGTARRSVFNTSFPEARGDRHHIRFVRFGRVLLDVEERIPDERIAAFAAKVSQADDPAGGKALTRSRIRALLIDAEVALFHLAADRLAGGISDLSPSLQAATEELAQAIDRYRNMSGADARAFRGFVRSASPWLLSAIVKSSDFEPYMLRACLDSKAPGRKKTGDEVVNNMCVGFLDDWRRRTQRSFNYATTPGSAHHFYITAIELMVQFPPREGLCPVRAAAAAALPELHKNFDDPWWRAVKRVAGG